MNVYIDNRNYESIYAFIILDNKAFDVVYVHGDAIVTFELPGEAKKARFIFKAEGTPSKYVQRKLIKQLPCEIKKRRNETDLVDKEIRFPYATEINLEKINGSLVMYPDFFEIKNLQGGMFFRCIRAEDSSSIEFRLIKRADMELNSFKKKELHFGYILLLLAILVLIVFGYIFYQSINDSDSLTMTIRGSFEGILLSGLLMLGSIATFMCYKKMYANHYIDEDMQQEYIINDDNSNL